jgi:hypothetical protein
MPKGKLRAIYTRPQQMSRMLTKMFEKSLLVNVICVTKVHKIAAGNSQGCSPGNVGGTIRSGLILYQDEIPGSRPELFR